MLYENSMETVPRELNALKAVYDPADMNVNIQSLDTYVQERMLMKNSPRLISDSMEVNSAETMIAFTGIFQAGGTFSSQSEPGKPATGHD